MHFVKVVYGEGTTRWANYITCTSGFWYALDSEFLINNSGTKLYSNFLYKNVIVNFCNW